MGHICRTCPNWCDKKAIICPTIDCQFSLINLGVDLIIPYWFPWLGKVAIWVAAASRMVHSQSSKLTIVVHCFRVPILFCGILVERVITPLALTSSPAEFGALHPCHVQRRGPWHSTHLHGMSTWQGRYQWMVSPPPATNTVDTLQKKKRACRNHVQIMI